MQMIFGGGVAVLDAGSDYISEIPEMSPWVFEPASVADLGEVHAIALAAYGGCGRPQRRRVHCAACRRVFGM
jgi:hypothetical protein